MKLSEIETFNPTQEAAIAALREREEATQAEGNPRIHAYDSCVVSVVDVCTCVVAIATTHGVQAFCARHDRSDLAGAVLTGWLGVVKDEPEALAVSLRYFLNKG